MGIAVRLLPVPRRPPRTLSNISPQRAARYDTSCRSARYELRTPGRTSPAVDSRAGTGDTSLPSLQRIERPYRQGEGSPRVRPRQFAAVTEFKADHVTS